jgi:hypothetical protein
VDISQVCAIETREDATAPALRSDAASYYFDALNDEFRVVKEQAKLLPGGETECAAVTDLATLKTALAVLQMNALGLNDAELEGVVNLVKNISNPYG